MLLTTTSAPQASVANGVRQLPQHVGARVEGFFQLVNNLIDNELEGEPANLQLQHTGDCGVRREGVVRTLVLGPALAFGMWPRRMPERGYQTSCAVTHQVRSKELRKQPSRAAAVQGVWPC